MEINFYVLKTEIRVRLRALLVPASMQTLITGAAARVFSARGKIETSRERFIRDLALT